MLVMRGAPALSAFRHDKLLSALQAVIPTVTDVYGEFYHFADISEPLTEEEQSVLTRILKYGPKSEVKEPAGLPSWWFPVPVLSHLGQARLQILPEIVVLAKLIVSSVVSLIRLKAKKS